MVKRLGSNLILGVLGWIAFTAMSEGFTAAAHAADCDPAISVASGKLLFVFIDAQGNFDSHQNITVNLPSGTSHVPLPAEVLARAKAANAVKVYHSTTSDSYIIPYAESRMNKDFDPANDCPAARASGRVIHGAAAKDRPRGKTACEGIRLTDVTNATLLYDQTANACENFARYQTKLASGEKLSDSERAELKGAVTRFNEAFGGPNRSPSILGPATNISTRKTQEIGTSMQDRESRDPAGSTSREGETKRANISR